VFAAILLRAAFLEAVVALNFLVACGWSDKKYARDGDRRLAELLEDSGVGAVPRARWPRRGVRGSAKDLARRRA
jgi:hypothetical protein